MPPLRSRKRVSGALRRFAPQGLDHFVPNLAAREIELRSRVHEKQVFREIIAALRLTATTVFMLKKASGFFRS